MVDVALGGAARGRCDYTYFQNEISLSE